MFISLRRRNIFLIFLVVIFHTSLLLSFHYLPVERIEKSSPEFVSVNLLAATKKSLPQKKYAAKPQEHSLAPASLKVEEFSSALVGSGDQQASALIEISSRERLHGPKPPYPLVSRRMKEQGLVIIKLCVNPQGSIDRVDLLQSSGHHNLDRSALQTLAEWRFASVLRAYIDCYRMPIQFTLEG